MWNGIGLYGFIGVITTSTTDISLFTTQNETKKKKNQNENSYYIISKRVVTQGCSSRSMDLYLFGLALTMLAFINVNKYQLAFVVRFTEYNATYHCVTLYCII